jgi:type III secretion protein S
MSSADTTQLAIDALTLTLVLSMPPVIVATLVGLLISLVQALTQIQEQTLSFAVKLICVAVVLVTSAGWYGGELYRYTLTIFARLASPQ